MSRIGALISLLAATPAAAQITTYCNRIGAYTNCTTNVPPPGPDYSILQRGYENQQRVNEQIMAASRARQEERRAQAAYQHQAAEAYTQSEHRKYAGEMIAAGNCDGALDYALKNGELDLATSIKTLCQK